jgi:hypothetical protein
MKSLLAMLFSVVLILSQAACINGARDFAGQKASVPKCCGHCAACKGKCCCVGNNDSGSRQPAPAVPSHGFSQNDLQFVSAVSIQLSPLAKTRAVTFASSFLVGPSFAAPLYQRNCCYII